MSESKKFTITLPKLDSTDLTKCTGSTLGFLKKGTCTPKDRSRILKTELKKIFDELKDELKIDKEYVIPECIKLGLIRVIFYNEDNVVDIPAAVPDITAYFIQKDGVKKHPVHTVTRIEVLIEDLSNINPDLDKLALSIPEQHKWLLPFIIF